MTSELLGIDIFLKKNLSNELKKLNRSTKFIEFFKNYFPP